MMRSIVLVLFIFVSALHSFADNKRVALVIGNASYNKQQSGFSPLRTPLNDARAMAEKLEGLGFELTMDAPILDADQKTMRKAVAQFEKDCVGAEVALFYYSGHGAAYKQNNENLLLPVDEEFSSTMIRENAFALETVERVLVNSSCPSSIIILDACRNNPYGNVLDAKGNASDINEGLLRKTPAQNTVVYYATSTGKTAKQEVGNGVCSIYTEAWLDALSKMSDASMNAIFNSVKKYVLDKTNKEQLPEQRGNIDGNLYGKKEHSTSTSPSHTRGIDYSSKKTDTYEDFVINGVTFRMIKVNGGTFTMGATNEFAHYWKEERPTHQVTLDNYYIGETEVTQELWNVLMNYNPSSYKEEDNLPVDKLTWQDCKNFIWKLNTITGRTFRLPTEAEWEFAARGGNRSNHTQYSGSDNVNTVAWFYENSGNKHKTSKKKSYLDLSHRIHPVATKEPNELGLYDMSGNVAEFCSDWYDDYESNAQINPQGPMAGYVKVIRGGCYHSTQERNLSCVGRECFNPELPPVSGVGFRLVLSE